MPRPGDLIAERYELVSVEDELHLVHRARALDREVEVEVALWLVPADLLATEAARSIFVADAIRARAVTHPSLCRIFDAGQDPAGCYATLQAFQGPNLAARLRSGPAASDDELVALARPLGEALGIAQVAGLVHGFLIPDDVRVVDGLPKLAGPGLWRALDRGLVPTALKGRERYLAPEVRAGQVPTASADVFSLAVILGELALGHTIEAGLDPSKLREALRTVRPEVAQALDAGLSEDAAARPASASILAVLLENRAPLPLSGRSDSQPRISVRARAGVLAPLGAEGRLPRAGGGRGSAGAPPDGGRRSLGEARVVGGDAPMGKDPGARGVPVPAAAAEAGGQEYLSLDEAPPAALSGFPEDLPAERSGEARRRPARLDDQALRTLERAAGLAALVDSPGTRGVTSAPTDATPAAILSAEVTTPGLDHERAPVALAGGLPTAVGGLPAVGQAAPLAASAEPAPMAPPWLGAGVGAASASATIPRAGPGAGRGGLYVALVVAMLAVAAAAWLAATLLGRKPVDGRAASSQGVQIAPVSAARPGTITPGVQRIEPCPAEMRLLVEAPAFCIDTYEAPGQGITPITNVSLEEARRDCENHGKRLCSGGEWERACRGTGGADFPAGAAHARAKCNLRGARPRLAPAGAFPECVSAAGAFDLSGNAAEWVADGSARGGSVADGEDGRCSRAHHQRPDTRRFDLGYRCCLGLQ